MGSAESKVKKDALKEFGDRFKYGPEAIDALHEKFLRADVDSSGTISADEFVETLSFHIKTEEDEKYARRLFEFFDPDKSGSVEFREFVIGLSNFSSQANPALKRTFAFRVYDFDGNGTISRDEFLKIMKATLFLSEAQIKEKSDEVFEEADLDHDGVINLDEFQVLAAKYPQYLDNPLRAVFSTSTYS